MFRRFRHKLLLLLQAGIFLSGTVGLVLQPQAWQVILLCTLGSSLTGLIVGRVARKYLHATLGRLRRVADDLGHGRPAATIDAQPGDDMYKLTAAINLLAQRLADAAREEKRLHEELRRRERLAFLGELGASVAHEVNNPLDGVQNCVRILRRSLDDPQRAGHMLDLIGSGLQRIEWIVRRLLTLGREYVVEPAEVRLGDVVETALEAATPRIEGRGIRILRHLETDDDRALIDRALMEQVFVNLLLNAADSIAPGADGGRIVVTVRREGPPSATDGQPPGDAGQHYLCVDFADNGSGIPADILPRIFEPFFTTKTGGDGTGLGLAIANRIVDAHHGTISVAARPGGGTVFTVRIPVPPAGGTCAAAEAGVTPVPAGRDR